MKNETIYLAYALSNSRIINCGLTRRYLRFLPSTVWRFDISQPFSCNSVSNSLVFRWSVLSRLIASENMKGSVLYLFHSLAYAVNNHLGASLIVVILSNYTGRIPLYSYMFRNYLQVIIHGEITRVLWRYKWKE